VRQEPGDELKALAMAVSETHPIVFFDGVCGLCNIAITQLLKHDTGAKLRFAPLQGDTAKALFSSEEREHPQSLIVLSKGCYFRHSDAIIEALLELSTCTKTMARFARLLPLSMRDKIYRLVAKYRYYIWKKSPTCRIPTPAERARFLP